MEWDSLKRKVREEQTILDKYMRELHAFRLVVSERYDDDKHVIEEVENDILTKLDLIDGLSSRLNDHSHGNTARQAHISRVKEMNIESRHEVNRVSSSIKDQVRGLKLFGKKRISRYSDEDESESNLLRERSALTGSLSLVDQSIESARRAKMMIEDQTWRLSGAKNRLELIVSKIPLVSSLTARIRSKTFRDKVIIAFVLSLCIFFLLWSTVLSKIA